MIAIVHSAQDSVDEWRRNSHRRDLNSSLREAATGHQLDGILTSALDLTIFRCVGFAIQANVGHGYTNPARLINLGEQIERAAEGWQLPQDSTPDR